METKNNVKREDIIKCEDAFISSYYDSETGELLITAFHKKPDENGELRFHSLNCSAKFSFPINE
jgi:hypothetical protein